MSSPTQTQNPSTASSADAAPGLRLAVLASRIAIVDNLSTEFLALRKVLSEEGFGRVVTIPSTDTTLQEIRKHDADLIVLDPFGSAGGGVELLTQLKSDPILQDAAFLVVTASQEPESQDPSQEIGADAFLRQPVGSLEVVSVIHRLMESDLDLASGASEPAPIGIRKPPAEAVHPDLTALRELERKELLANKRTHGGKKKPAQPVEAAIDDSRIRASRIVIVDDEPFNFMVLRKFLSDEGYSDVRTTSDSTTAVTTIRDARPDLVILDVVMPQVDGIEILKVLKSDPSLARIPVLILTATADASVKKNALDIGATDFLNKPVDSNDLLPRVRNSIMYKLQQDQLRDHAEYLEDQVRLRTSELIESRRDIVRCLARAGEYRDTQTGYHVLRVGMYAGLIADELGFSPAEVEDIELAAQLHDLGKIAIPDAILLKPGKLTEEEIREMRRHCRVGMKIIQPDPVITSVARSGPGLNPNRLIQMAAMIASTHHEHWDGGGYPCGLSREQIPIEGRITAVADVFDALSSKRPYKEAFDFDDCFEIMERQRNKHFDPAVLDALTARRDEIIHVRLTHEDGGGSRS
ncbi:MAG: response regulator [Planctomycetaceae bacterium]